MWHAMVWCPLDLRGIAIEPQDILKYFPKALRSDMFPLAENIV